MFGYHCQYASRRDDVVKLASYFYAFIYIYIYIYIYI